MKKLTLATAAFAALAYADQKIDMKALPQAVQQAISQQLKTEDISAITTEKENGKRTYEVVSKGRTMSFDASGKLLETEEDVELSAIPGAAREGLQKLAGQGTIKKVEAVTGSGATKYEADVKTKAGRTREIRVSAEGIPEK